MANRYWVGGTAAWDGTAGTKWATTSGGAGGASVPTSADAVFFTNLSTGTCTISAGNTGALSINCTGHTGTITGTAAISVAGSVTLVAGQTFTYTGTLTLTAAGTLTTGGKTLGSLVIDPTSGTVSLGSALTCADITHLSGTFTTTATNYNITATSFASNVATPRTVQFNGSTVTLSSTGIAFDTIGGTNLTFTAGTSTIIMSNNGSLYGQGYAFATLNFTGTAISSIVGRFASCTNLTLTAPSVSGTTDFAIFDCTISSTLTFTGTTAVRRIMVRADGAVGTQRTVTVTTISGLSDIDFLDIGFNTSRSGTRLGNCGGNTNIVFPSAKTVYWNLAGSQDWAATGWATTSGGTPAVNNFPLAQDTAIFDDTGAAGTVTIGIFNTGTINMSARTSAMTFNLNGTNNLSIYGDLVTGSGITYTGTGTFTFIGRSPQQITTAGKTITQVVVISSVGSSVTLLDALTMSDATSAALALRNGTFNLNGYNVTLTSGSFNGDGGLARTLAFGTSVFSVGGSYDTSTSTNLTVTGSGTIRLTSSSQKSFSSGSANYSGITIDQAGSGLLIISNAGTLGNISNSYASTGATSIRFDANQTLGSFTASGQAGRVLTITSSGNRTLTKTSGIVSVDYISIQNSTATGGATWYAGANSTNVGNNNGWIFTAPPSVGNFIAFFM